MADLPILFSAPMVLALLREAAAPGTGKTQTRRKLKKAGERVWLAPHVLSDGMVWMTDLPDGGTLPIGPPAWPGDRLYVREHWRTFVSLDKVKPRKLWEPGCGRGAGVLYDADNGGMAVDVDGRRWISPRDDVAAFGKARRGMHMPRWASRLTLYVTDVRVQRLQDISEADARAEGAGLYVPGHGFITEDELRADPGYSNFLAPCLGFEAIWTEINGPGSWAGNPWVAAYTFAVRAGNIDSLPATLEEVAGS